MDSQAQLQRTHGHHQAEEPIRIHHPEEAEHHEKGPAKVLKKAKEKVKKALTKHGHGHEQEQELCGAAPARGRGHHISDPVEEEFFPDPMKEDTFPPGTKLVPVVSSSSHTTETTRGLEPVRVSHGHEALARPVRPSGVLGKEVKRDAPTT